MRDAGVASYGCLTHSLQLVVSDGMLSQKSVSDLLAVCRQIVGHFKRSTVAYDKLSCTFTDECLHTLNKIICNFHNDKTDFLSQLQASLRNTLKFGLLIS